MSDKGNQGGAASGERRRSSAGQRFAGLMQQKRNPADEAGAARRLSTSEQMNKPGFIGQMWNNYTKGPVAQSSAPSKDEAPGKLPKQSIHRTGAGTLG